MKKLFLVFAVAGFFALSSCSKCAECSVQQGLVLSGEYCKGNVFEDALYASAKEECEQAGGKFN